MAGEEGFLMRELCYLSLTLTMQSFVLTHTISFSVPHYFFMMIQGLSMLKESNSEYYLCAVYVHKIIN